MAFNFNWSPLTADAEFYRRARDLLTTALNKSPKPPIIVDDILVSEFNLGTVPPDLEILEIGDLAEDRFRGIFKMCYSGDAFLTLKTRVQVRRITVFRAVWFLFFPTFFLCLRECPATFRSPTQDHAHRHKTMTKATTSIDSCCCSTRAVLFTSVNRFCTPDSRRFV